jgi:hypothetical protein
VKSVVAIEAKLSKWHEALLQAKDNLTFADYSYVLPLWQQLISPQNLPTQLAHKNMVIFFQLTQVL